MENHPLVIGKSTISMGNFPVRNLLNCQRVSRNSQQISISWQQFVRDDPVKVIGHFLETTGVQHASKPMAWAAKDFPVPGGP